jgi:hypothetical protein
MSKFVSSSWFPAKSVEQLRVEQSQFEQFTPTRVFHIKKLDFKISEVKFFLSFLVPYVDKMVSVSEEWIAISILRLIEMVKLILLL